MANAVLVVDMLKEFMEPGHKLYCGNACREIIPRVRSLLERESGAGSRIFFICDSHDPDDLEFRMFPQHCIKGSEEAEVIRELGPFVVKGNLIKKNRYSGFFNTGLEGELKELKPDKVIVCGVCTDICVLHTAADARNRDYPVDVPAGCVASFDAEAHEWALQHIEKVLGCSLVKG